MRSGFGDEGTSIGAVWMELGRFHLFGVDALRTVVFGVIYWSLYPFCNIRIFYLQNMCAILHWLMVYYMNVFVEKCIFICRSKWSALLYFKFFYLQSAGVVPFWHVYQADINCCEKKVCCLQSWSSNYKYRIAQSNEFLTFSATEF